ncbi:class I SAM-dependent methyltransferase [Thermodesulfobacteriota bacterium]
MSALKRLGINKHVIQNQIGRISGKQKQTQDSFSFKWKKRDTYSSESVRSKSKAWLLERYCDNDPKYIKRLLDNDQEAKIILDAGCGAGYSASLLFGDLLKKHDYLGIDISDAIVEAQSDFKEKGYPGEFLRADISDLPIPDESVDLIFSEGVLHHTDDTEKSLLELSKKLKKRGYFLFYIYKKKAIIREFTDDYIRDYINSLNNNDAWESLKPLTKLGINLGKMQVEIDVPEDIPFLNIKKGSYDLQRFFYWNICKMFYHPDFSLDEMNHTNFDWFRPLNCHRHTPEEVEKYCKKASLNILKLNTENAGITVVAQKY